MSQDKPKLLVTRRMPDRVTARIERAYNATLNHDDVIMSADELIKVAAGHAGILCCGSERFNPELIAKLPESVRIVSTLSVGYEPIDVAAAKGYHRHQHAGRPDGRYRRRDNGADSCRSAPPA